MIEKKAIENAEVEITSIYGGIFTHNG